MFFRSESMLITCDCRNGAGNHVEKYISSPSKVGHLFPWWEYMPNI